MRITEEIFCFCYMFVSSLGLLYQLVAQSVVTVECEKSKTFCLRNLNDDSRFRHTLTAKDLEIKCNNEGISLWLWLLVFLGIFFELLIFGGVVYVYYNKIKTIGSVAVREAILKHFFYATICITGLLISLFVLFPFATYIFPVGGPGDRGVLAEMWYSPPRGLVLLTIKLITAPFRWAFHNRFKTELRLDKLYENFTCVEPTEGVQECPMEARSLIGLPDPSHCESDFFCTQECYVVFPRIIISSLSFIFASFALCHRLLTLTYYITQRVSHIHLTHEQGCSAISLKSPNATSDSRDEVSTGCVFDDSNSFGMKDKCVPRAKAAGSKAGSARITHECKNSSGNVRNRGECRETTVRRRARDTGKINEVTTAKGTNTKNFETILDRPSRPQSHVNGTDLEYKERQKSTIRKNLLSKESQTDFLPRSMKFDSTGEAAPLSNGIGRSELKPKHKAEGAQGKATRSMSNGHVRKDLLAFRRGAKLENRTGTSEVKNGLTRECNGSEECKELELSSDDLVENIDNLLVEDESEFFMSGFRL